MFCTQVLVRTVLVGSVAVHVLAIAIAPTQFPAGVELTSTKLTTGTPQLGSPAIAVARPVLNGCVFVPRQAVKFGGQEITGTELQAQLTVTLKLEEVI